MILSYITLYYIIWFYIILYFIIWFYIIVYYLILYYSILFDFILYYMVLNYIYSILYYFILCCIILYHIYDIILYDIIWYDMILYYSLHHQVWTCQTLPFLFNLFIFLAAFVLRLDRCLSLVVVISAKVTEGAEQKLATPRTRTRQARQNMHSGWFGNWTSVDLNTGWLFCWLVACNDAF